MKVQTVLTTLRTEGIAPTARKIFRAVVVVLRPVGRGDILTITSGTGDSALYRGEHVAEELRLQGFTASSVSQIHPLLQRCVNRFSIFIFHRTPMTPKIARMVAQLKKQNKKILFSTDDLIYDPHYSKQTEYYRKSSGAEKEAYARGIGAEFMDDTSVTHVIASTEFLAQKMREKGKDVFVVSNKLSQKDLAFAEVACKNSVKNFSRANIRIGYFSGNATHDADFAVVNDVLADVLKQHENVELLIVGAVQLPESFTQYGDRIIMCPYVARAQHFKNLASCDIVIAPLVKSDFTDAKSELKFFEAGSVRVPVIASASATFTRAIRDGVDGFVARDAQQWKEKFGVLITNAQQREEMGCAAYKIVMQRYATRNAKNQNFYDFLQDLLNKKRT